MRRAFGLGVFAVLCRLRYGWASVDADRHERVAEVNVLDAARLLKRDVVIAPQAFGEHVHDLV